MQLTAGERAWLSHHREIRLGIDPDWAPFEFIDHNREYAGIAADYVRLIAKELGVSIVPVPDLSWSEAVHWVEDRKLDMLAAVSSSPNGVKHLAFTKPYIDFPIVVVTRNTVSDISNLSELAGRPVAVVKDYFSDEVIARRHPEIRLIPVATLGDGLKSVAMGQTAAFIGNMASIAYAIDRLGLNNLKVAAFTKYQAHIAFGVRSDWPQLVDILERAMAAMDPDKVNQIRQRWIQLNVHEGISLGDLLRVALPIALGVIAVLLVVFVANRRLRREVEHRKRVEADLRQSEERLHTAQEVAGIGSWVWELASGKVMGSDALHALLGYSQSDAPMGIDTFVLHVHPDDRRRVLTALDAAIGGGEKVRLEHRMMRKDGSVISVENFAHAELPPDGTAAVRLIGLVHDITERRAAERRLEEQQRTLQTILDNAPIGIWLKARDGRFLFVNRFLCQATGVEEQRFRTLTDYTELFEAETAKRCSAADAVALASEGPQVVREHILLADGEYHDLEVVRARLTDEQGQPTGLIALATDVTDKLQAEEQLKYQAYYDALTGLPNRLSFMEQLRKSVAGARRHQYLCALLFFDLDNFKMINDSMGHQAGDELLRQLGTRLSHHIREEDIAARLGGDEFVVILNNLTNDPDKAVEETQAIAAKLQNGLSAPYQLGAHEHHITPSIGIAMYPLNEESAEDVLKYADTAMYRAKEAGRNAIRFFLPSMQQAAEQHVRLYNAMRSGLSTGQFKLHYQPQVEELGRLVGAECLLRWHHPERGMISPVDFIPVAEDTNFILALGEWALREACRQLRRWQDAYPEMPLNTLAVNVSSRQFAQPEFVPLVRSILKETGADPRRLELEVTETVLLKRAHQVRDKMLELGELGVRFAIDDFGTGYSSLAYIKSLPVHRIKIDQSFVRDIATDRNDAAIVEAVLSMARHLGVEAIAEGVEHAEQLAFLRRNGCQLFQGYYFSAPVPAERFAVFIEDSSDRDTESALIAP